MSGLLKAAGGAVTYTMDQALHALIDYEPEIRTVETYDFGGRTLEPANPGPITLSDIGRSVVLRAQFMGPEIAPLLDCEAPWTVVRPDDDLATTRDESSLFHRMRELWDPLVEIRLVGAGKASKLLHPKYPSVFPILDSRIVEKYRTCAHVKRGLTDVVRYPEPYWIAIRRDLREFETWFSQLKNALTAKGSNRADLTDIRILDILTWLNP